MNLLQFYMIACYTAQFIVVIGLYKVEKRITNMDLLMLCAAPITMTNVILVLLSSKLINLDAIAFQRR
jgi:hypothetical protein